MNIPRIPTSVASGSGSNAIVTIVSSLALVAAKAIIENEIKKHYLKKLAARETNPADDRSESAKVDSTEEPEVITAEFTIETEQ